MHTDKYFKNRLLCEMHNNLLVTLQGLNDLSRSDDYYFVCLSADKMSVCVCVNLRLNIFLFYLISFYPFTYSIFSSFA